MRRVMKMTKMPKTTTGRKVERFFWIVVLAGILLLLFASCRAAVDLDSLIRTTVKVTMAAVSEEQTLTSTVTGDGNVVANYGYDRYVYWMLGIAAVFSLVLPQVRRFVIATGWGVAKKVKTFLKTQEPAA